MLNDRLAKPLIEELVGLELLLGRVVRVLRVAGQDQRLAGPLVPPGADLPVVELGGAYGIVSIIRPLIAREILGEEHFGTKAGGLAALYLFGGAAAPYLGSLIWAMGGYDLLLGCLMLIAASGLALYLLAQSKTERSKN